MAVRSPEPATRIRRSRPAAAELVAAGSAAALVVACLLSPDHIEDGPVICPFRNLTGLPCPGCGLTRSWVYLTHGRLGDGFSANPFGAVAIALVLALVVASVRARLTDRPAPDLDDAVTRPWFLALLAGWLAFAVVRLALAI